METTRRDFLKLLGVCGLVCNADLRTLALAESEPSSLPRRPALTGSLTSGQKENLWRIFSGIGKLWQNGEDCDLKRVGFEAILDLKTGRAPSYLSEYQIASAVLKRLMETLGEDEALRRLFFEEADPETRIFVLAELIALQLAHGGFRFLGFRNYKGFMAGSFGTAGPLPYRAMDAS